MQKIITQVIIDKDGNELKKQVIGPSGENTKYLMKQSGDAIFPLKYYKEELTISEIKQLFDQKLATGEEKYIWNYAYKQDEVLFVRYDETDGTGCQHFSSNCQIKCSVCSKFFGCTYCHDIATGFENEHKFVFGGLKCVGCNHEQGINQNCAQCGEQMFDKSCEKCNLFTKSTNYHHCDQCDKCVRGHLDTCNHCTTCNTCYSKAEDHNLVCGRDDACTVCQGEFDQLLYFRAQLACKHAIHDTCVKNLMAQQGPQAPCPVCRQPIQTIFDYEIYKQKWLSQYSMTEVDLELYQQIVEVQCLNCKAHNNPSVFVQHKHQKGYICPFCSSINCSELELYKNDDFQAKINAQNELVMQKQGYLVYPLVLSKPEMPELIDLYVNKYKQFWLEAKGRMKVEDQETTELRELVEAYFLIKEVDESIGFAALNLVHTRQFKGELREILTEVAKTCAEVREVRRLGIE
ncbi:CHY_and RING-type zinc-finger domain-containing protein [Hexamita inflata]|uniref:CHY and RING-type zinc-finger domain-containing protein n=1 Tax=Hexamita inflata TaxID=28002 RepID=A0AA86V722_9EUKA|nr:CHY and RING-type zinc-finger domain-containing protein [Hexamita inflata]CAI9958333.1 CHY and RING-type zinc-finger domain-containing protein [Hexamita inflata]